ncbi:MAG: mannitol dehydrogenase family protein [Acidobacteria bacterium]|nr:mannitol dehydrogenase family protein [Acidobacteriota bacterium]
MPSSLASTCDNIPRNGEFLRQRVLAATVGDLALTRWIEANVAFPSCVVDRIVPAPTALDLADASGLIGVRDRCAVSCEGYSQWVMEDDFVAGRPAWEHVGVIFTDRVEPYQLAKLRILNGAHSALAYLGALAGHELIADVLDDDLASEFALRLLRDEVVLTLTPPPGVDLNAYAATVLERFRNRALGHRCVQVAYDGSQKLPIRLLPTLRARLASGLPAHLTILVIAAWMRYVSARHSDDDLPLLVADPLNETIARILHAADGPVAIVDGLLSVVEIFGADLAGDRGVRDELVEWLTLLSKGGARCAMAEALKVGD